MLIIFLKKNKPDSVRKSNQLWSPRIYMFISMQLPIRNGRKLQRILQVCLPSSAGSDVD
jgi:hypothetical protein